MIGLESAIASVEALVAPLMLISLRVGTTFAAMPAPFGDIAPVQTRVALTFMLSLVLLPFAGELPANLVTAEGDINTVAMLVSSAGEVYVGAVIGVTVRVILAAIAMAGTIMGFSTGLSFAQSVDPALGESMTPVASALSSLGIAFFLAMSGHHVVIDALAQTLRVAPPGDVFSHIDMNGVVRLGSDMVAHGLRIASPVVATMFIVQLGLALTSRAAPRVQIFQLSFAVAVSTGLLLLFVASPSLAPAIMAEVRSLPRLISAALSAG